MSPSGNHLRDRKFNRENYKHVRQSTPGEGPVAENRPEPGKDWQGMTSVAFTNLKKMLYPELGISKARVIEYYIRAAPRILPYLRDRPVVLNRFPDGIHGEGFYEKDAPMGTPEWVETFLQHSETTGKDVRYVVCNNLDTLIWLANLATLELNIPLSRIQRYDEPDFAFFDLDPEPPAGFSDAVPVAHLLKERLSALGLTGFLKTSGKKGIHIAVPLTPGHTYEEVRGFVHTIGRSLARTRKQIVAEFTESQVPGTIFIDYLQNVRGKTMICPYSLRASPGATVSTPISWAELDSGVSPENFTIENVLTRSDPWTGILEHGQELPDISGQQRLPGAANDKDG
jgi:bifunctional non-homologous end joining protein LigD